MDELLKQRARTVALMEYAINGNEAIDQTKYGPAIGWLAATGDCVVELDMIDDLLLQCLPVS